jgi:hypothetical protein
MKACHGKEKEEEGKSASMRGEDLRVRSIP